MAHDIPNHIIQTALQTAFAEDLGQGGDVTSRYTVDKDSEISVLLNAREHGCLSGGDIARHAFQWINPDVNIETFYNDGDTFKSGDAIMKISGNAYSVLATERNALNFLCHMSGISTRVYNLSKMIEHTNARICCTRKTTPGLRALEKYAVLCGGGQNHRYGLYDAILIKDNHIAANNGNIRQTVEKALKKKSHMMTLEVEVDTLDQLREIIDLPIDVVLLDNMPPEILKRAIEVINGRAVTEASGGINEQTIVAIAESGVDMISMGSITNSSPNLDFGLDYAF